MKPSDKGFIFDSGKEVYAHASILSVCFDDGGGAKRILWI